MDSSKEPSSAALNTGDNASDGEATASGLTVERKVRSRSKSPSTQPLMLKYRLDLQIERIEVLTEVNEDLNDFLTQTQDLESILARRDTLDSMWQKISTEHDNLMSQISHTQELMDSRYVKDGLYMKSFRTHMKVMEVLKKRALKLKHSSDSTSTQPASQVDHLPEISLPKFDGSYSDWPQFRDLFESLIINSTIQPVRKMHYLKTSLTGNAQSLIKNIPTTGDQFERAWKIVEERYQNKRLLITTQVENLLNIPLISGKSSERLDLFIYAVRESLSTLKLYGSPVDQWDHFLVPLLTKKIDSSLKEAWELKIGSSVEMPKLDDLLNFLSSRARAIERMEVSTPSVSHPSSYSSATKKPTPHSRVHVSSTQAVKPTHSITQSSARSTNSTTQAVTRTTQKSGPRKPVHYPCDMCGEPHYIVTCPDFYSLTVVKRREFITKKKLCRNCMGHHDVSQCNTTKGCKHCGKPHHTMLHLISTS